MFGASTDITGGDGVSELSDVRSGNGSQGFVLNGVGTGDRSGGSVSSAGDVNGDGIDDLIIGAADDDPHGLSSGASFVVFGSPSDITGGDGVFELSDIQTGNGSQGFVLNGVSEGDYSGGPVSSAGDVNGDGLDDLIVAAEGDDPHGTDSGAAFVIFGSATDITGGDWKFNLSQIERGDGSLGFVLHGVSLFDGFEGIAVSSAGDIDGDGFDDLFVRAAAAGFAGKSYVVFGGNFTASVTLLGTSGADALSGTSANEVIIGAQGNDTISSGAGDDLMTGAEGDDLFVFANSDGNDTIRDFGRGNDTIDVTDFGFASFAAVQAAAADIGQDVTIALDAGDSLTLLGVNLADLVAGDFLI